MILSEPLVEREIQELHTMCHEFELALKDIEAVAQGRLEAATASMSDNDYAAFDHISGIARRAKKEEV